MTAGLWRATAHLADAWRSAGYVQEYLAGARGVMAHLASTGGEHLGTQPLLLAANLPAAVPVPAGWHVNAVHIANGYIATFEWLRSRLAGYPFPGAPQLAPESPWTTFTVAMRLPWLADRRSWQLHLQPKPPTMPFITDPASHAEACAEIGEAVMSSPAAAQVEQAWSALTDEDKMQLEAASGALRQAADREAAGLRGEDDFRQLAWSEFNLDEVLRGLTGRARALTDALTDADRMMQQAAALLSQLVMTGQVRKLANIGLIDQVDGPGGWHHVRSDSYLFEPIRILEIIGFDHPCLPGAMLVEGTAEQLPIEPISGSVTVRGRILADSVELAATAVPIRKVFVAPGEP